LAADLANAIAEKGKRIRYKATAGTERKGGLQARKGEKKKYILARNERQRKPE